MRWWLLVAAAVIVAGVAIAIVVVRARGESAGDHVDRMAEIAALTAACERAPGKACVSAATGIADAVQHGEYPTARAGAEIDRVLDLGCTAANAIACHTLAARVSTVDPDRAVVLETTACDGDLRAACDRLRGLIDAKLGSDDVRTKASAAYAAACERKVTACGKTIKPSEMVLVDVSSNTATEAFVDGQDATRFRLPTRIRLAVGTHTLTFIAGDKRCEQTVTVKRGPMPNLTYDCR